MFDLSWFGDWLSPLIPADIKLGFLCQQLVLYFPMPGIALIPGWRWKPAWF